MRNNIEREGWPVFVPTGVDIFRLFLWAVRQLKIFHHFHLPSYTYTRTMSDHEVETFESTDAGASKTVPMQAVPSARAVISSSKAKRARYFLRLVVGFEKMNRNSRDRVLSRRESRAFYARFERAYIHRSRSESFRWGTEPFASRFARRCAQKSPLTFCVTHSLLPLNSPLPPTGHRRFHVQNW